MLIIVILTYHNTKSDKNQLEIDGRQTMVGEAGNVSAITSPDREICMQNVLVGQ